LGGGCVFLHAGRCAIHEAAPFGCAFLDFHMSPAEGQARSRAGIIAVLGAWKARDAYADLWHILWALGRRAPDPATLRDRFDRGIVPRP
jgi:hypothetical protein